MRWNCSKTIHTAPTPRRCRVARVNDSRRSVVVDGVVYRAGDGRKWIRHVEAELSQARRVMRKDDGGRRTTTPYM